jgi:hypothetical protein
LTPRTGLRFPAPEGVSVPPRPKLTHRMDFGAEFASRGIIGKEPPALGDPYALLVPQAGADGIDMGGIRLPEVAEPLGIYTGWNPRARETGSPDELAGLSGSFFPFTKDQIEVRHGTREAWLKRIEASAAALEKQRFLLPADRARILESAGRAWDLVTSGEVR